MKGQWKNLIRFFSSRMLLFLLSVFFFASFSCGLPTVDYLYPTNGFSQIGANLLTLRHNSSNTHDNGFLGYDIYYRAFENFADADASYQFLVSTLTSSNFASVSSQRGYYPLLKKNSDGSDFDHTVLISYETCESNKYEYFALNMRGGASWTISGESASTELSKVVRNKGDGSSVAESEFYVRSQYLLGDRDYSGTMNNPSQLYFVFLAVAVGNSNSSIGVQIYSNPNQSSDIIRPNLSNPYTIQ